MNYFDSSIILFFNQFARMSWKADLLIKFISENHLIKGGFLITLLWWAWSKSEKDESYVRIHMIYTVFCCFAAIVLGRLSALLLPFRLRPMHSKELDFILPYKAMTEPFEGWSSFPSDHAVLFFALATCTFLFSKRVGLLSLLYTSITICLPRIYLGLHYPTDIIAGAMIGIAMALLCRAKRIEEKLFHPVFKWSVSRPELFYPAFFLVNFLIVDMFDSARAFIGFFQSIF